MKKISIFGLLFVGLLLAGNCNGNNKTGDTQLAALSLLNQEHASTTSEETTGVIHEINRPSETKGTISQDASFFLFAQDGSDSIILGLDENRNIINKTILYTNANENYTISETAECSMAFDASTLVLTAENCSFDALDKESQIQTLTGISFSFALSQGIDVDATVSINDLDSTQEKVIDQNLCNYAMYAYAMAKKKYDEYLALKSQWWNPAALYLAYQAAQEALHWKSEGDKYIYACA
jgi:hypothetical protein